jgi:hypothetical protein
MFYVYEDTLKRHNVSPLEYTMWMSPVYPPFRKHKRYLHKLEENRWVVWHVQKRGKTRDCGLLHESNWMLWSPALIFPRENWKNEFTVNTPLGTLGTAHQTGCTMSEMFLQWLKHFSSFVKHSQEDKSFSLSANTRAINMWMCFIL